MPAGRLDPDSPYYSYQGSLVMDGPLDLGRLARAWDLLLQENPLLLARFTEEDGEPAHQYPHWDVPFPAAEDLSGLPPGERARVHRDHATAEAARPFDLTGGPSLRARLFAFGGGEHRLLVTMHEILLDGWGATVLFQRLADLYERTARPGAAPDPERAGRYDRYLDWHADLLRTPEVAEAGAYWRRRLAGELPVLDIAGNPRPARPTYRGGIVEAVVGADASGRLRAAAARAGCTPFVLLLAAYALALTYYADADEVVIGAPMANRERPEQAGVPAFMLAMLPLRVRIDDGATLASFTGTVRDLVLDACAAADHPFGWTLRHLTAASRSEAVTPVFQTMINMLAYPARDAAADGVSFRFVELDTGFTKYDCALYVQPHGPDALLVQFSHQRELLDTATARNVLDSTLLALRALVDSPETHIRALDLLPGPSSESRAQAETTIGA
ncbi:condensation domain-containing protein [Actinomadura roseirufa]|uniref:condensation domain-containing protein n=1 Tax=Actinomadura roseirufa TaxID=2094049 RepID=UPI0013F17B5C|nr:condensation domain-containing protein [Actinomadura roseirufa]